ncbi:hypothetical protein B0A48_15181 [Cryoendolithus antarcticus]|uniref:Major royal jelly protein n=1 Tax=Cryoendolithus antarcticus TaxID=1507870 RepID=A0A1V8SI64_9PEZI|nr:hypothetical protein B0A48_15181 [Cryoendolithus antarcticus]
MSRLVLATLVLSASASQYFATPPGGYRPFGPKAPTGLAIDTYHNIYLTYPRNSGSTPSNVVICTSFNDEKPWPNAAIQNCTSGQDPSTCLINVQNVVLDSISQLWIVDSGIPYNATPNSNAISGGAKIMSFNETTGKLIKTYTTPTSLLAHGMNANDVRINNTLGARGFAFITDESRNSSILAIKLATGATTRRLFNTSVVRADEGYVGSYNGEPVYSWNGTNRSYTTTGADGIALASGDFHWRYPVNCASEQAGFSPDDNGRLYIFASEQNATYYVDTLQSQVTETVNGVPPNGTGLVKAENYVVKTLVRNAMVQHADSGAILDGWCYFNTNQLEYSPRFRYGNVDARKGPFRSFRIVGWSWAGGVMGGRVRSYAIPARSWWGSA